MNRTIDFSTFLIVLLGIWLCYLAFETVRWVAFTLLFHWGLIAALLATGFVVWVWRKVK